MPIQHWTPDTTSQSSWQGTQALAGGISGGIKSLTDSIEAARKERKKESDLTTVLRKKLTVLNPDRKDEFNTMGLNDLTGEDMAHAESVLGEKRKMEMDQFKQRSEAFNMQQEEFSRNRMNEEGFNRDLGALMKLDPQSPELGNFYENPEQTNGVRPSRTPGLMEVLGAASRHGQAMNPQLDNILNSLQRAQPKQDGNMAALAASLGMVPSNVNVGANGGGNVTFGMPTPPTPTSIKPLSVEGGGPSGKGLFGDKIVDIQAPNAEGKTLTQSENQVLGALNQAGTDLDNLEKIFKKLGPDWGGPISGRAKNAASMGQSPDITAVENAINAATPNLARGVFREVGVLTDEDIKRYKALLPTAYDTDSVRKVKMDQLRDRIVQGKKETMDGLRKAGRDVSGFDKAAKAAAPAAAPPGAAGKTHEQLIQEANAAIAAGKDETKVRARLKELGVEVK